MDPVVTADRSPDAYGDATKVEPRPECRPPANWRTEIEQYDAQALVGVWRGPHYAMTYRVIGEGPPLLVVPAMAGSYQSYALLLNRLAESFQTIVYDYPGTRRDDGARLSRINHEHLVDDAIGLLDHLSITQTHVLGISFGSTVTLAALREARGRFLKAALQGGFAHRHFTPAEKFALGAGTFVPGNAGHLPFHDRVLAWNNLPEFPRAVRDRWPFFLEQRRGTSIAALAHRCRLLARLDLRQRLSDVKTPLLAMQGNEDRVVPKRYYEQLIGLLPHARGCVLPLVGHQMYYTHPEVFAKNVTDFLLGDAAHA
jgi:pimeloyl-ACP methyl ester carboxylesterase